MGEVEQVLARVLPWVVSQDPSEGGGGVPEGAVAGAHHDGLRGVLRDKAQPVVVSPRLTDLTHVLLLRRPGCLTLGRGSVGFAHPPRGGVGFSGGEPCEPVSGAWG